MTCQQPFRRTFPLSVGLALSLGVGGIMALSEPRSLDKAYGEERHGDVDWKIWESVVLKKEDTTSLNKWVLILAPKRDIFKNLSFITPLFLQKCNASKEAMTIEQFFRWVQFHTNRDFTPEQKHIWTMAFDLNSNNLISLNEFISVYVLIQTMEKKNLKKRDLFKWTKANFRAIDIDNSGYLDFEEVVYWIEFAIRAGYVSNKHASGKLLTAEELADLTVRKYDENFDGKINFEEFRSMFNDLLTGHFTDYSDPSNYLVASS